MAHSGCPGWVFSNSYPKCPFAHKTSGCQYGRTIAAGPGPIKHDYVFFVKNMRYARELMQADPSTYTDDVKAGVERFFSHWGARCALMDAIRLRVKVGVRARLLRRRRQATTPAKTTTPP